MEVKISQHRDRALEEVVSSLMVVEIRQQLGVLTIEIADFLKCQGINYEIASFDNSLPPKWLSIDSETGFVSAVIPEGLAGVNFKIIAKGVAGEVRVLEIVLDLAGGQDLEPNPATVKNLSLQQQISKEHHARTLYGAELVALVRGIS
jgi:hypothetical protein